MAKVKFDLGSIVKNVHNALDPEAALPPDQEKNPIGYRAARLGELVKGLKVKHEEIADELGKMETNLDEVIAELKKFSEEKEGKGDDAEKKDEGEKKDGGEKKDDGGDK